MKKLRRSSKKKKIFGVCGGLSNLTGLDVRLIRIAWIGLGILPVIGPFAAVILYLLLAFVIPEEKDYIDIK